MSASSSSDLLAALHLIWDGTERVTRAEFRAALKQSIGADSDYADLCYTRFKDNPAGYLTSRQPQSQSIALLDLILKKSSSFKP